MRSIWLILLVITVVLLVTAESRRGRKPGKKVKAGNGKGGNKKPNRKECPSNCNNCDLAGRCLECDDGFAKITLSKRSKSICVPCSQQLSNKRKGLERDTSKCPAVPTPSAKALCPKNCSSCKDGICLVCDRAFALVSRRKNNTICIPCGSGRRNGKKVDKSQCGSDACGRGCLNCTEGTCSECKDGFELNQDKNKCKKKKDCGRGCRNCTSGVCLECKAGLTLNRKSRSCVKLCSAADPDVKTRPGCEGKPKGKGGKKKRKGGKGKPNRKPTPKPQ